MKLQKKLMAFLLVLSLAIGLLAGCGTNRPGNTQPNSEVESSQKGSETDKPSESDKPSETESAKPSEPSEPSEPTETETEVKPSEPTETESETQPEQPVPSEPDEPSENPKPTETEKPSEPSTPEYTFKDLNQTKYATKSITVYDEPSTGGKKLGTIAVDAEVKITGQCKENDWYRISFNGKVGYIADKNLTSTKPAEPEPPKPSETESEQPKPSEPDEPFVPSADPTPAPPAGWDKVPDFSGKDYSAEYMAQKIVDCIIKDSMSEFEKAHAIHDWLTFHIDYDKRLFDDATKDQVNYHVKEALRDRTCVCQGYAEAFEMMAELVGLEATFVGGEAFKDDGSKESHAWNQVKIDGVWYNVDVTWDDPTSDDKKPNDHSGNRYDYFLISDEELQKDHVANYWQEDKHTCSKNYDRTKIYKAAAESGAFGAVGFVKTIDEANAIIKKYMDADKDSFTLWVYDKSVSNAAAAQYLNGFVQNLAYMIELAPTFYYSDEGLIKCKVFLTKGSEWYALPVVTNTTEFAALLDEKGDAGVKEYLVRYEVSSGEPKLVASKYGLSASYQVYNGGKSWLVKVIVK